MKKALLVFFLFPCFFGSMKAQSWLEYYDSSAAYWGNDWEKANELLLASIDLAEGEIGVNHPNYTVLLNDLGISYWSLGEYPTARNYLEKSIRLKRISLGKNDPDYLASLLNLAGLFQDMKDAVQAEHYYLQVLESYDDRVHKDAYYFTALKNLGKLYESEGNFSLAEKIYLEALKHREQTVSSSPTLNAQVLHSLASLYQKTSRYTEADTSYLAALTVFENQEIRSVEYAHILGDYALFHAEKGNFGRAEELIKESSQLIEEREGKNSRPYAEALNNLGSVYSRMGLLEQAEAAYLEAVSIFKALVPEDSPDFAAPLNNLASYFATSQQYQKAMPLFLQVKDIYEKAYGNNHYLYSHALNNLASLHRKLTNYEKAAELYAEVLDIEKNNLGESHPQYASSLQNVAMLEIAMGNYEIATSHLQSAIKIKERSLDSYHPSWAATYNNLGLLYFIQNKVEDAAPFFAKALENQFHQIKNVFPSLSESEKEAFYRTLKDDLERFNTFALQRYEVDSSAASEIYNNQLVTKGLLFNATNKVRENIFQSGDQQLIEKYNEWRTLREELARAYQLPREILMDRGINLEAWEQRINELEKQLSSRSFALNPQSNWQTISWMDVREKLSPGEAAIEIVRFRKFKMAPQMQHPADTSTQIKTNLLYGWTDEVKYIALIVTSETKDNPILLELPGGKDLEERYLSYYSNAVRYQVEDSTSYLHYWQEIRKALDGIHTVYFSPDGAYFKVNVNTLYTADSTGFVLDQVKIKQVTSTRDLVKEDSAMNGKNLAVLLGDPDFNYYSENIPNVSTANEPSINLLKQRLKTSQKNFPPLPATRLEIETITSLLSEEGWDTETMLDQGADEGKLKLIDSPKVLHIATHGFFEPTYTSFGQENIDPYFLSGLLLTGATHEGSSSANSDSEDGILTAYEAMNLKLDQTDLVILSACETGVGTIKNGEGVYGLQRAFQVAGTKSIIFSLWKVDDEATQKLMTYFYDAWMKSFDRREAFALAQKKLKTDYPHPYYWGGFILVE